MKRSKRVETTTHNRTFPIIEHINDVVPAMKDRDEFFVADRSQHGFKVINYKVAFTWTFDVNENDMIENHGTMIPTGLIRRELRGIMFDSTTGVLISRPFHKFFNIGERSETRIHNIDLSQPHVITEKMDGSMIRPLSVKGKIRLATKMGLSEIAEEAEKFVSVDQLEWMGKMMRKGITPLFEFISPNNRIVVEYDKSELVLLALRMNRTGEYLDIEEWSSISRDCCGHDDGGLFRVVPQYGSLKKGSSSLKEYIARQRNATSREGDVLIVGNNNRYKIKNDWYLRAHRNMTPNNLDNRRILALILNNELDDMLPTLNEEKLVTVQKFEIEFRDAYRNKLTTLQFVGEEAIRESDGNRKALGKYVSQTLRLSKIESRFVFGMAEGRDINDMLLEHIKSGLDSPSRYRRVVTEFLGLV